MIFSQGLKKLTNFERNLMTNIHKQIFFLVRDMQTDKIEPTMQEDFSTLFRLFKGNGFNTEKESEVLHPQSKIAMIDLTTDIPSLSVALTVFWGYMFATSFKQKTILNISTVLTHFDDLVIKRNSDLLDQLYRDAFRKKFPGEKQ